MQGKGGGPVNRVELESQVLCAALRQSCHLKDRIGAFTSVREMSHLFPDLLPPPEKHDDISESNKANFYSVLGIRPQTSANGVISAYLRSVRSFLRSRKVQDSRIEYNRILNAGFILRKPRLRLSHDLVVARRWLHEESRLAQMATADVTLDRDEALRMFKDVAEQGLRPATSVDSGSRESLPPEIAKPVPVGASSASDSHVSTMPPIPPVPAPPPAVHASITAAPPNVVPPSPAVSQPNAVPAAVAEHSRSVEVPPVPPLPAYAQSSASGEFPALGRDSRKGVEVPPVPPLPVHAQVEPTVVPPVPNIVSEYWDKQPAAEVPPHSEPAAPEPLVAEPAFPAVAAAVTAAASGYGGDEIEIAPGYFVPASSLDEYSGGAPITVAMDQSTPAHASTAEPVFVPDAVPTVTSKPIHHAEPAHVANAPLYAEQTPPPVSAYSAAEQTAAPVSVPGGNGGYTSSPQSEDRGFPPAAVRAHGTPTPPPADSRPSGDRPPGRISKEATFVFDESALHRPQPAANKPIPMLIQLMEAAQFITAVEVQALLAQMEFAPNVPVEKLILNAGYVTPQEMASIKLGESLLNASKITMAQFQVAIYDERTSGLRMAESLQVRGWLSVEVRNAIDEFHKKRT